MRQKRINKSGDSEREIGRIGWKKQREILKLLAGRRYQLTQIARQYGISEKTVHRIRARAIKDFAYIKRELPASVQDYLKSWTRNHGKEIFEKSPRETKLEKLEQHKDDLYKAAERIYAELCECCAWPAHMTIEEINLERNDPKLVGLFLDKVVIGLLAHLQADIEELKSFARWEDLTPNDISNTLLGSISMKATKREFNGRCDICRDW